MNISSFIIAAFLAVALIGFEVDSKRDFIIAELIHRDSYMSQLNNSLKITTSFDRINDFNSSSIHAIDARDIESEVTPNGGHYLMKIKVGVQEKLLTLSITLAFTLIFCEPCKGCHQQDKQRFPSSLADTEKYFPVESTECRLLRSYKSVWETNSCGYKRNERRLSTIGMLRRVKSFFGSGSGTESQFHLWFICVVESERDQLNNHVEGLAGLGPGPYSLINQLAGQLKIAKKFCYCLLNPYKKLSPSSKIIFGNRKSTSTGKVTVPFTTEYAKPYYYLSLDAIQIGSEVTKITIKKNIRIDSELMGTWFPRQAYDDLVKIIKDFMVGYDPVPDKNFRLCYNVDLNELPYMFLVFDNEAILHLRRRNIFVNNGGGNYCMMIDPARDGSSPVLGTFAQMGFEVEYDLEKSEISFAKADDCNKFGIQ